MATELPPKEDPKQEQTRLQMSKISKNKRAVIHEKNGRHLDWDSIEKEYIFGVVKETKKGEFARYYPSTREMARRLGVPLPTVGYHARKRNWTDRREAFKAHLRKEFDQEVAKARALSAADALAILDTYIRKFGKAVEQDAVARSTIKDLDIALRAKAFVQKEVDRSDDATTTLNLSQLQSRHAKQRAFAEGLTEEEVGFSESRVDRETTAMAQIGPSPSGASPPPGAVGGAPDEPPPDGAPGDAAPAAPAPKAPPRKQGRHAPGYNPNTRIKYPAGWPTPAQAGGAWYRAATAADRAERAALRGEYDPDTHEPMK